VIPAIGYLTVGIEEPSLSTQFHRGLGEQGYVDGRNAEILYRRAQTRGDRSAMAADLVRGRVTVLVGTTAGCAVAAKSATATIPIVFVTGADPVELGLVASLSRPSGNVTGATFLTWELTAKRLQLLHEIVPGASSIAFLVNSEISEGYVRGVRSTRRDTGVVAWAGRPHRICQRMYGQEAGQPVVGATLSGTLTDHRRIDCCGAKT
jgi:ABC-type uncharacterized transport system substrate-binding protein